MKVYEIVLFIFLINIMIALANATFLFNVHLVPNQEFINTINNTYQNASFYDSPVSQEGFLGDFWGVLKSIGYFATIFAVGVAFPGYVLIQFGVPVTIALIISVPVWFLYVVGFIQLIRGAGFEGMS